MFIVQDESLGPDPFYDLEQHALLGVANFFLECLHHGIKHEYSAPIVAPTGKVDRSLGNDEISCISNFDY